MPGSGRKTFTLMSRLNGKQRRWTIGHYSPRFSLADARRKAAAFLVEIEAGRDPHGLETTSEEPEAITFGQLTEQYLKREVPRLKRGKEVTSIFHRHLLPAWEERPITELRKRDAIALIDSVLDEGKPGAAFHLHEAIKRIFNWAVDRDELEVSPFANLKPPVKKTPRNVVLKDDQIRDLWMAWNEMGYPFGQVLQLLLLTGQRRNEVAEMCWQELDWTKAEWVIPEVRSKSGREHIVPLANSAINILKSLPRFEGPYVFTTTDGRRPVSGFSKCKQRADRMSGVSGWRIHDLRRTVRTKVAALGVPEIVGERILNHLPQGLTKTYNVHDYTAEKRHALQTWAKNLSNIIGKAPLD
jgi:integrase